MKKNRPILHFVFFATGGKIYMDWLLITNSSSKNPLIKWVTTFLRLDYSINKRWKLKTRYVGTYILSGLHIVGFILFVHNNISIVENILINVYPVWVQVYIGDRCKRIMNIQKTMLAKNC
jgi:hypothetical protein